ncbi:MAG TPA: DJ-1/PfpI family protein [Chloroflexota bacterium]|jgi:transcriptional regulator GlxA family with amidase domain|nr:DJ-1/PfpI family protein [Chloroflexota bacterium]
MAGTPPAAPATRDTPVAGILLFDQVEVLDFAGPYEVLAASRDAAGAPAFRVLTIAARATVRCVGGLRVLPDTSLADCPPLDLLVVPGGPGAREPSPEQETTIPFIRQQAERVQILASVCTGAFLLARAGLLTGRRATTHRDRLERLQAEFPDVRVERATVVDEGRIVTAAGVASGIDLGLHLLARWYGPDVRRSAARRLDGPWE